MRRPHPGSRTTLAQVAEHAGVSTATVSLILGNRTAWVEQFHPRTVQKVRASAERLGYRRNLFASGLPSGRPPFFALVLSETRADPGSWHYWAFRGAFLEGVHAAAERRNVFTVSSTIQGDLPELAGRRVSAIMEGGVFGTILQMPGEAIETLVRGRIKGHPLVVVFPERVADWPTNAIDLDNAAAGQLAGRLLASAKRRHWALIHGERMSEAQRLRCEGLRQMAGEADAKLTSISLPSRIDEDGAKRIIASEFEQHAIDGVYAVDAIGSIGAVLGCFRAGLTPGSDCAVVGCDVSPWRLPGLPRVTSVDVCWREVGAMAVEKLLKARDHRGGFKTVLVKPRAAEAETCPVPAKLKARRSPADNVARDLSVSG